MSIVGRHVPPRLGGRDVGPHTEAQLDELLAASTITLRPDVLDAIDEVVAPGTTLHQADVGWVPPGVAADHRRRP